MHRGIIVVLILFQGLITRSQEDVIDYESFREELETNLDQDRAQDNINLIDSIALEPVFLGWSCLEQGRIFHLGGVSAYYANREYDAIRLFKKAVDEYWFTCPETSPSERANTIYNIGVSYQYTPDILLAKPYIDEAVYLMERDSTVSPLNLADKYLGAGSYYVEVRDMLRAETYLDNALQLYRNIPGSEAQTLFLLNQLLILKLDFEQYSSAKQLFEEAEALILRQGDQLEKLDIASIFLNGAEIYLEDTLYHKSSKLCQQALNLLSEDQADLRSNAYEILGIIAKRKGELDLARSYIETVARLRSEGEDITQVHVAQALALENLSEIDLLAGLPMQALQQINSAMHRLNPQLPVDHRSDPVLSNRLISHPLDLIRQLQVKQDILHHTQAASTDVNSLKHVISIHEKIDTLIQKTLSSVTFEISKLELLQLISAAYGKAIESCLTVYDITDDQSYWHKAFYFSSRAKSLVLDKYLMENRTLRSIGDEDLISREKEIKEKMSAIQKALAEDLATEDSLMVEFAEVQLQAELFEQQLQKKYPAYYRQKYTYAQIPSVQEIQQRITANDLVLDFYQLSDGLVSFWITKDNFFIHLAQAPELFGKIDQLIEQCQSPEIPMSDGLNREVFDLMLLPGFKQLRNQVSRIYLIPEGELHGLPFAILQNAEGNLLIEEFTLSRSYSSSLLLQEEDKSSNRGSAQFTGFATKYSPDLNEKLRARSYLRGNTRLEQLSLADRELDAARAIFEGKTYLDRNASLENFTHEAPNSDILYLSLHGLVDYEDPAKSCIIFDDRNTQFILSAYDLAPLQFSTDLLVLSACHSASGKIYRGEGVKGMTRSFLASGVKSVVSSLWSATERSVFTILPTFLKFYADGLDKASALRCAQLDYLASVSPSRRHPYYWANLILVGHLDPPETPSYFWFAILCIMIVVGLSLVYVYVRKRSAG